MFGPTEPSIRQRTASFLGFCLIWLFLLVPMAVAQEFPLQDIEDRIRAGAIAASSRTVMVRSVLSDPESPTRIGSGAIIASKGLILTCAHVLVPGALHEVVTRDGRLFEAELIGSHPTADLALLRVDAEDLLPFRIDRMPARPGDWALALGHPLGPTIDLAPSAAVGRIRAVGRDLPSSGSRRYLNMIWSDIPLEAGASGGPLVSLDGLHLLGVNAVIDSERVRTFSIPITRFRKLLSDLARGGTITTPILPGGGVTPPVPGRQDVLEPLFQTAKETASPWTVRITGRDGILAHGTVLRPDGLVVTVSERIPANSKLQVQTGGGHTLKATVLARDHGLGLALLRVESSTKFPAATRRGDPHPPLGTLLASPGVSKSIRGVGFLSARPRPVFEPFLRRVLSETTAGRHSSPRTLLGPILQHDTPLDPSDLGGPLVDREGRLVGINVASPIRGVSLAVPMTLLDQRIETLARGRDLPSTVPGYLGIHLDKVPATQRKTLGIAGGVLVTDVLPGFPAAGAELAAGDVIVQIGEQPTALPEQLIGWLLAHPPGTQSTLQVRRGKISLTISVVLGGRP